MTNGYKKPLPTPSTESRPFWEAAREHRLVFQECADCGRLRHYPQPMCPACGSFESGWEEYTGGGRIHTWTVVHEVGTPGFAEETPYKLVVVELDNGLRLAGNLRNAGREHLQRGQRVRVIFEDVTPEVTLPQFEPA
jgi:uncharacterized OB-fold protein